MLTLRSLCVVAVGLSPFLMVLGGVTGLVAPGLLAAALLLSAGAGGFQLLSALAALTGWKEILAPSGALGRASDRHRLLWLAGAALMTALHYPLFVVAAVALGQAGPGVGTVRDLLPFSPDPWWVLAFAAGCGLAGGWLASVEPAGHGLPRVRAGRETPAGAGYAERLAERRARTAGSVADAEARAAALAAAGDSAGARARLRDAADRLGAGHPDADRLRAAADGLGRGPDTRTGGGGPVE